MYQANSVLLYYKLLLSMTTLTVATHPWEPGPTATSTSPDPALPAHCTTTSFDAASSTPVARTHECFTLTKSLQSANCSCVHDPELVCPMVISLTTVAIPCSTDCCPTTPTVTAYTCPTSCNRKRCTTQIGTSYVPEC
ncbi:hypothetical protein VTK73DRAFT_3902 [Phialemonium thermophilum]|uniref:Uncharacterized protein n=1 Tax=Phialemonium thermophilum TaxID=223376 RepID=A0ABR3WWV2_9PEZI